jgi:hypothetical protein
MEARLHRRLAQAQGLPRLPRAQALDITQKQDLALRRRERGDRSFQQGREFRTLEVAVWVGIGVDEKTLVVGS